MRGKDEWGTLQLMSNTRDLRERRVREGERRGEEIRGYRLISIGDKRLRKIFSPPSQKKNSLIKYLQQLSVVGYIGHLWPV